MPDEAHHRQREWFRFRGRVDCASSMDEQMTRGRKSRQNDFRSEMRRFEMTMRWI